MSAGSTLGSLLTAVKAHAVAVAVAGVVVVGGGAAAVAATAGAGHLPSHTTDTPAASATHTAKANATAGAAAREQACANHNGDAQRLAAVYSPMFAGDKRSAQDEICTLFAGSDGHAFGFGEIQQVLDIAATIERHGGSTACLTSPLPTATPGRPGDAGKPSFVAPTQAAPGATMALVATIMRDAQTTPLQQLAGNCNVPHRPGAAGTGAGTGSGTGGGQGNGQGSGKPEGTPGAKPTGTPGHP